MREKNQIQKKMQTGYLLIFNMQPLCHLLLVSSCIFKILFSPPLSQTEQTDTELIVKFDKAPYICIAGLFSFALLHWGNHLSSNIESS